jgi:hypothetical protein
MLVVGRLEISEDAWVELVGEAPDPWSFDGWLGRLRPYGPDVAGTRSEVLKGLRGLPHCDCRAVGDGDTLRLDVSGWLRPPEFREYAADLVDLFIRAYPLGGLGTLWFLADQTIYGPHEPDASYVVWYDGDQPRLAHPSEKRQRKVLGTVTFRTLQDRVAHLID